MNDLILMTAYGHQEPTPARIHTRVAYNQPEDYKAHTAVYAYIIFVMFFYASAFLDA